MTKKQLDELADIHSFERWKKIGRYLWRVECIPNNGYVAV